MEHQASREDNWPRSSQTQRFELAHFSNYPCGSKTANTMIFRGWEMSIPRSSRVFNNFGSFDLSLHVIHGSWLRRGTGVLAKTQPKSLRRLLIQRDLCAHSFFQCHLIRTVDDRKCGLDKRGAGKSTLTCETLTLARCLWQTKYNDFAEDLELIDLRL